MAYNPPHPPERRSAVLALLRDADLSMRAIAARTGVAYDTVRLWNRKAGTRRPTAGPARKPPGGGGPGIPASEASPDLRQLDAALRSHIARQIARFDAQLRAGDGTVDSARVLRDLGGLKRLLDELAAGRPSDGNGAGGEDADGGGLHDLAALRARIARRYEAFAGERGDAGLPGAAAPAAPDGAGA